MFDCRGCKQVLQDEEEYKWRPNWCKKCAAAARKEHRDRNPEKYREAARRSSEKHGEKYAKRSKCYTAALAELREAHKEEFEKIYERQLESMSLNTREVAEEREVELVEQHPAPPPVETWQWQETEIVDFAEIKEEDPKPRYAVDM